MVVTHSRSIVSRTVSNDAKNIYKSPQNHINRNSPILDFPELDIKLRKISSVILLLQCEEIEIIQKALNHLDKFVSLGSQQLYQAHAKNLYDSIVKFCTFDDMIVKRFAYKLLVQFTADISDCKKMLLKDDALIEEIKTNFMSSSDDVLVEFTTILMQSICDDPQKADSLAHSENFFKSLFNKFKSHDADILLHSIQLLNVIMKNSMLIESIMLQKDFPFKNLQIELKNEILEIQIAALESFLLITNFYKNPFWDILSSERLIEAVFEICMKDSSDNLQKTALKVFKNLCNNENLLLKLSQSDYLSKFLVKFMDKSSSSREVFLSVLIEFAKIEDNKRILSENGIVKEILAMLNINEAPESIEAIALMSTNLFCLKEILSGNVYKLLIKVAMDNEKHWSNRTLALTTFLKLISFQGFKALLEIANEIGDEFSEVFKTSSNLGFSMTAISVLVKLSEYHEIKVKLASSSLARGVFALLGTTLTSTQLTIRLFSLASSFIDQESFQQAFIENKMIELIDYSFASESNQLRSAVCNFINAVANYPKLREVLISDGILKLLMNNFDCKLCSDAFETILQHDLSLKFAVKGQLEAKEKIYSGFYATKGRWINFQRLHELMKSDSSSPVNPVYTINFEKSPSTELKLEQRRIFHDKNLIKLIDDIKKHPNFLSYEPHEKVKIISIKISKFLQLNDDCVFHQLQLQLSELKFKLASSVIPLGNLICGNSFEAALLFKAVADQLEIDASLHADDTGKGWNRVSNDTNVVDLFFDVGEMYEASSSEARKYFQRIL